MTREQTVALLLKRPYKLGHMLGFTKLTELHNDWIIKMVRGKEDETLQAHRSSYKTTCVSLALGIIIVLLPNVRTMFMRKTDTDIKEIVEQVKKILQSPQMRYLVQSIYGVDLKLIVANASEISTNLTTDPRGTPQLMAMGVNGSLTGKHFDRIFTDDIVNLQDRISKAERDHTKTVYQELQNIRNRGGRIFNTGTPWHKEDAFSLMPNIKRFDCYATGLISESELQAIKGSMTSSLFAVNYELRHVASEDVIFDTPKTNGDPAKVEQGICHIDAAYDGADYTAFTICRKADDIYYLYGRIWRKHVDDCEAEILALRKQFNAGRIHCETNADKGYLAKSLIGKGERVISYHENMNKFYKITSYLKAAWEKIVFVAGTDEEYINQICDYNENAEHDDAPDSAASMVRILWNKKESSRYMSMFTGV